jgi:hypothetical protein
MIPTTQEALAELETLGWTVVSAEPSVFQTVARDRDGAALLARATEASYVATKTFPVAGVVRESRSHVLDLLDGCRERDAREANRVARVGIHEGTVDTAVKP